MKKDNNEEEKRAEERMKERERKKEIDAKSHDAYIYTISHTENSTSAPLHIQMASTLHALHPFTWSHLLPTFIHFLFHVRWVDTWLLC